MAKVNKKTEKVVTEVKEKEPEPVRGPETDKGLIKIICPMCKNEIKAKKGPRSCERCNVRMMTIPVYEDWLKSIKKK